MWVVCMCEWGACNVSGICRVYIMYVYGVCLEDVCKRSFVPKLHA